MAVLFRQFNGFFGCPDTLVRPMFNRKQRATRTHTQKSIGKVCSSFVSHALANKNIVRVVSTHPLVNYFYTTCYSSLWNSQIIGSISLCSNIMLFLHFKIEDLLFASGFVPPPIVQYTAISNQMLREDHILPFSHGKSSSSSSSSESWRWFKMQVFVVFISTMKNLSFDL